MLKNFTLLGRVVQSLIKLSWNKRKFWFQVLNFSLGFSDFIVRPSVLSLNDLNLNKTEAVKNVVIQENFLLRLASNTGLALTGF